MDELILLIKEIYTKDDIGQMVSQKPGRAVWATLKSVSRAEWFKAGEMGMKPQLVAITPYVNYEGETIVLIGNDEPIEFSVYKTFHNTVDDTMELYLERKVGNDG